MTPAARYAAAIEVLDKILSGVAAESALTNWARSHRFAGSKDRAAIRDHVYECVRRKRSLGALGGGETGRALVLGLLRSTGLNHCDVFSGDGYAPAPLSLSEVQGGRTPEGAEAADMQDWQWRMLVADHGDQAGKIAESLQQRAPVFLRTNLRKNSREAAMEALKEDGIFCKPHPLVSTALIVEEGARRIAQSGAYLGGLVEIQDASSQDVVLRLPLHDDMRILDFCAGGGGKALAMAAGVKADIFVHDANFNRMKDIDARADRAGIDLIKLHAKDIEKSGKFDLVLCDLPCSGSGSWRRDPNGKWALTEDKFGELVALQSKIVEKAADFLTPSGVLALATCSIFHFENKPLHRERNFSWVPNDLGDGFFLGF
jgi:16S rRNA (cytosine967-C5)-methyltransferase